MKDSPAPIAAPDIWQATLYDDIFRHAKTQPLLVTCERRRADGTFEEKQFVTKTLGHPDVNDINLFAEIFGNLLGRCFGITTCDPHIIYFTDDFIQATRALLPSKFSLRPGYGVGTFYDPPLEPIIADFKIPPALRSQAALLYAFDLLVFNPDRKRTNSNCAARGNQLIAFDFDEAFFFLESGLCASKAQLALKPFLLCFVASTAKRFCAFWEASKARPNAFKRCSIAASNFLCSTNPY